MYKLRTLEFIHEDEREFEDLEDAECAAVENSIDDSVWAVCDEDSEGEVVALAFGMRLYS